MDSTIGRHVYEEGSEEEEESGPCLREMFLPGDSQKRDWLPWWRFDARMEGFPDSQELHSIKKGCGLRCHAFRRQESLRRFVVLLMSSAVFWSSLLISEGLVFLCVALDLRAQTHPNLVITAIVLPLALTINSAFHRHERALDEMGVLRAAVQTCFQQHLDWRYQLSDPAQQPLDGRARKPTPGLEAETEAALWRQYNAAWSRAHLSRTYEVFACFLDAVADYLSSSDLDWSDTQRDMLKRGISGNARDAHLQRMYAELQRVSEANERLRAACKAWEQRATAPRDPALFHVAPPLL
eukprot:Hpha_TRINITY_DN19249_c0_g1::TRINITY_DN19249_c0_g1_i1::g.194372::m.194372